MNLEFAYGKESAGVLHDYDGPVPRKGETVTLPGSEELRVGDVHYDFTEALRNDGDVLVTVDVAAILRRVADGMKPGNL